MLGFSANEDKNLGTVAPLTSAGILISTIFAIKRKKDIEQKYYSRQGVEAMVAGVFIILILCSEHSKIKECHLNRLM